MALIRMILCLLLALHLLSPARDGAAQEPIFSARVDAVRIDVLVLDRGRFVSGLRAEDFAVWDNGVRQQVELVALEELPLNLVLAFDTSGSVSGERVTHLREAAASLLGALHPADNAGFLTFNDQLVVHAAPGTDRTRLLDTLNRLATGGETALVDAAYAAMVLAESPGGRPVAVVFSDGVDTASFLKAEDVLNAARVSNTVVYAVSVRPHESASFLDSLCEQTGGRMLRVDSIHELKDTLLTILNEVRQRYVISYSPRGVSPGGWHRLEVRVQGRRATVRARPGYTGTS